MKKLLPLMLSFLTIPSFAQDSIMLHKYDTHIQQKTRKVDDLIQKRIQRSLNRLIVDEQRMRKRLMKSDSTAAHRIFDTGIERMKALKALSEKPSSMTGRINHSYNSYLDTLQVATKFLSSSKELSQRVDQLRTSVGRSEQIGDYLYKRQQELKAQLSQYTAFTKDLQRLNKQTYYYRAQIRELSCSIQDRDKIEARVMTLLRKSSAFQDFFKKNSVLASLLGVNGSISDGVIPEGLQTRSQVEQLVQQRIGSDQAARQAVTEQVNQARDQFNQFKEQFPFLDNAAEMPDFKPNPMKVKRFLQRLEFGGNIQFQKANNWYPTMGDLAVQVAYKFTEKANAGFGLAYKLGVNSPDRAVVSSQGAGIRSFVDYRIKNAFSLNGGMEMNYYSAFSHIEQLRNWNGWQRSALLGVKYTYKISPKLKGGVTILYDFLAGQQAPFAEPLKIRFGYSK